MTVISESNFQQQCFMWHWNTYPDQRGRLWMQYNTPKNREHGAILRGMGMVAGVSDLAYLCGDGRMIFIELKTGEGRQSPEQKWWQSIVEQCGADYRIIRRLEDFKELISSLQN